MIRPDLSFRDLAFLISDAFVKAGLDATVVGGSAATIYAPTAYQSNDIDVVLGWNSDKADAAEALRSIGYANHRGTWKHPNHPVSVDLLLGPLGIGASLDVDVQVLREHGEELRVISPTDSVCDRLAAYIHWRDYSGLEQAVAVALAQEIDLPKVRTWCAEEGSPEAFADLERRVAENRARREQGRAG